jgi:transposase InsO family protein
MVWIGGPVNERIKLMQKWETGKYSVTELAEEGGVSRQCLHKWIRRWNAERESGMKERSRAPHNPRRIDPVLIDKLVRLKAEYPDRGPEKLVEMMSDREGHRPMAVSTAEKVLAAYGLVRHRKRRDRVGPPSSAPRLPIVGPGHTMTADHKGYFRLGNGSYCYPLTIADPVSRYLFAIQAQARPTFEAAWGVFERVFRDFGVPDQILTDNGVPFCSARSLGGLTELSKRWIKLGIHVARIDVGRPQQNGTHERIHKTLDEKVPGPEETLAAQQRVYESFRFDYDWLRPHKALGLRPPADRLVPFRRSYPQRMVDPPYPPYMVARRMSGNGEIKVGGQRFFVSEVLAHELVGMDQVHNDGFDLYFGTCLIGYLDLRAGVVSKNDTK